jgi:hypothetical protein
MISSDDNYIKNWVKIFETYDFMLTELLEAKFKDEQIEFRVLNKSDIGYTMEVGNSLMGRQAVGLPFKIYVRLEDEELARAILNDDWSSLLDNPHLDFTDT